MPECVYCCMALCPRVCVCFFFCVYRLSRLSSATRKHRPGPPRSRPPRASAPKPPERHRQRRRWCHMQREAASIVVLQGTPTIGGGEEEGVKLYFNAGTEMMPLWCSINCKCAGLSAGVWPLESSSEWVTRMEQALAVAHSAPCFFVHGAGGIRLRHIIVTSATPNLISKPCWFRG